MFAWKRCVTHALTHVCEALGEKFFDLAEAFAVKFFHLAETFTAGPAQTFPC